jgi:hypothetical protein
MYMINKLRQSALFLIGVLFMACAGSPAPAESKPADELDAAIRETSNYLNANLTKGNKLVVLNVTLTFWVNKDDQILASSGDSLTISKTSASSNASSFTASVSGGYGTVNWSVSGVPHSANESVEIFAADYSTGTYRLGVIVRKDGVPYSTEIHLYGAGLKGAGGLTPTARDVPKDERNIPENERGAPVRSMG